MDWLDRIKLAAAAVVAGLGVVAYYLLGEDSSDLVRVLVVVAAVAVALGIAMWSQPGQDAWEFIRAADREMRKVVWPTRRETLQTTLIVVVMVVLVGVALWLVDMGFRSALTALMG